MPKENIQEFRSVDAWNVSFCAQFTCRLTTWPKWADRGPSNGVSFSMMHDFRQSSEAVGLPQASKMLRKLTGQISAHYSTSKIRNIHLRLFRPDQGPYTVFPFSEQKGPIIIPVGVARRPIWLI